MSLCNRGAIPLKKKKMDNIDGRRIVRVYAEHVSNVRVMHFRMPLN